jgi:uncharacterized protein YecE (DUF72 family)
MKIHTGTSGWNYGHWRGVFYPQGLKARDWLVFYGQQFDTIELNVTFYRQVKPEIYEKWYGMVPDGFLFSAKMSRFITHLRRLKVDGQSVSRFLKALSVLAEKTGVILIQLPPSLKFDPVLTGEFFALLDPHFRYAVEARHESYVNDAFFEMLQKESIAWCISETAGRFPYREAVTADFLYMRLHGRETLYASSYREAELSELRDKLFAWGKEAFVYFDNDFSGFAARNALTLRTMVAQMANGKDNRVKDAI